MKFLSTVSECLPFEGLGDGEGRGEVRAGPEEWPPRPGVLGEEGSRKYWEGAFLSSTSSTESESEDSMPLLKVLNITVPKSTQKYFIVPKSDTFIIGLRFHQF